MKLYLRKLRLNKSGYTDKGMYFGVGLPVYEYGDGNTYWKFLRALTRDDAKAYIRSLFAAIEQPTFYR